MSDAHVPEPQLHDLAEGLLDDADPDAARVRQHVRACPRCASEVEAITALRSAAAALPPRLDPGVDLRPGIRATRRAGRAAPAAGQIAAHRRPRMLAAAMVVLVAAVVAMLVARGGPEPGSLHAVRSVDRTGAASAVLALDREYGVAGEELRARLASSVERLPPGTARLLAAELEAVEGALDRTRAALREDPASPVLRELVLTAHRQRMDVLRRAAALVAERGEA